jgi:hypothetical protein
VAPVPTYDNVAPLAASIDDHGPQVLVTFRCPVTGTEVVAAGDWPQAGLGGKASRQAKSTAMSVMRTRLAESIRSVAGTTGVGTAAGHAAAGAILGRGATTNRTPDRSEASRQAAVLDAFESVQDRFGWDDAGQRWVDASAVPPGQPAGQPARGSSPRAAFFDHLRDHPLATDHDREILVRMLAAIIAMDGAIGDEERQVFATFVGPEHDLDTLAARGSPGEADMAATQPGPTRETLLLLAWAVAMTDEDLGDGERALLDWFGRALYLPPDRVEAIRSLAAAQVAS